MDEIGTRIALIPCTGEGKTAQNRGNATLGAASILDTAKIKWVCRGIKAIRYTH
jgi:hypothetical protein